MNKEGLAFFTDTHWTVAGLLIFFVLFVILTYMQVRRYDSGKIETLSQLPMEKD
jgi:hypothetical protein